MSTTTDAAVFRLEGVTKRYSGALALDRVTFDVRPGEVHALLGENGAGKSTMAKIIAGVAPPDEGRLVIDGEPVKFAAPAEATAAGIAMVYQEGSLVDTMTVAQNLFLANAAVLNNMAQLNSKARHLLESHNFHIEPNATVANLGAAQKQMVEIARAVHRDAKVIIFDEPTASVTPEEAQQLFLSMHSLKQRGVGIIFITHNLEEALRHSDRITVMRDGVLQATHPVEEMSREKIVRLMVGRDVAYERHAGTVAPGVRPALEFDNVTMGRVVQNMSFSAYPGQVVVLAGLVGAGRTEAAMIAAGAMKRRRIGGGEIRLEGEPVRFRTPREAIERGIAYITEDRKVLGIFSDLSIYENIDIGYLGTAHPMPPWMSPRRRKRLGAKMVERFHVRTLNPAKARLVELSGGNQQKVLLAKGLTKKPKVVIFDEPTRGVDVGAIEDIHAAIRAYAEDGVAVIVISSYLPEVLSLADRVLVARGGRVVAEFSGDEATEEKIMFAAVH
ncbi:sugar ABC transporter ATP-binding protein [Georgenia ruanii]|uniref:ATP-binding cassette domain-containing protein n=1 Tax=Georgenia ruanii TaxID=348442 RepID=A0A7J9UV93_9MICO|nr:sugar ABC transporter ATP-binding protein [Georgenia ruanii]MPV88442.1 ATP-binding cassette domain-containing protein [Georgenia ruanii]